LRMLPFGNIINMNMLLFGCFKTQPITDILQVIKGLY